MGTEKVADWIWKVATFVLTLVIVPTFSWVWLTHTRVVALEIRMEGQQKEIETIEGFKHSVIRLEEAVVHQNESIRRIESAATK